MNSGAILNVCLKVIGIYYALSALNMLPTAITQMVLTWDTWKHSPQAYPQGMMMNFKLAVVLSILVPIILLIISLFMIFKSEKIVRLIQKENEAFDNPPWDSLPITGLNISIKIIGFFTLLSAIPHVAELISRFWIMKYDIWLYQSNIKIKVISSGLCALLYICTGILLIIYSSALTNKILEFDYQKTNEVDIDET